MKNLYLVRHCKAEGQAPDAGLTDTGLEQADKLADFFSDKSIDYIISSPYERAFRTIEPFAVRRGLEIKLDSRLTERVLSGKNHSEWRDMLRKTYDDLDLSYEGGESGNEAIGRAVTVIREILDGPYKNAVVVSHGNLLSLLLKSYDSRIGYSEWEAMSNPDVYHLSFAGESATPIIRRTWADGPL